MRKYFSNFNSISRLDIVKDQVNNSKGYGYLYLKNDSEISVLVSKTHKIHGKLFRVKTIVSKKAQKRSKEEELLRKIFVTGLGTDIEEIDLEKYFSKYGDILDILLNRDKHTGLKKGYAFILFSSDAPVTHLLERENYHTINNRTILCKPCEQKSRLASKQHADRKTSKGVQKATPFQNLSMEGVVNQISPIELVGVSSKSICSSKMLNIAIIALSQDIRDNHDEENVRLNKRKKIC